MGPSWARIFHGEIGLCVLASRLTELVSFQERLDEPSQLSDDKLYLANIPFLNLILNKTQYVTKVPERH